MSGIFRSPEWYVIKIGGELAEHPDALAASVGGAIRSFQALGKSVVVVHGAGPQASSLMKRLGMTPQFVAGQRVTDAQTIEVMKMALAGQVSVDVTTALLRAGVNALPLSGASAGLMRATRRPPVDVKGQLVDYGLVGDVTHVRTELLESFSTQGLVPVVASLAVDDDGAPLNVNADTVAAKIAAKLHAKKLFLVSNVPGVLANIEDPSSRIPLLSPARARAAIDSGVIRGGMIPKVEESLALLSTGVESIHIVSMTPADALIREAMEPGSCGTAFIHEQPDAAVVAGTLASEHKSAPILY